MKEPTPNRPLLVYDGACEFCVTWIEYWKRLTGDRVAYAPFQQVAANFPQVPLENFQKAVQLILPNGQVLSGAHAVFRTLANDDGKGTLLWLYEHVSPFAFVAERVYRLVADHRDFFYRLTRLLFGKRLEPPTFFLAAWLFLRLLGIIYFIAFTSLGVQITGLVGAHGILPVSDFLASVQANLGARAYYLAPTIFWLNHSDAFLSIVCSLGALLALLLIAGVAQRVILMALFVLYLSLVTIGQDFLAFQWDSLLLEAGFLAIWLGSSPLILLLFRWLLFRLMFFSGALKLLSGDPTWRTLTALNYHYQTQPLPTLIGWYMHHLPGWFHEFSVLVVFAVEVGASLLIFAPRRLRLLAAAAFAFLQTLIFLTGNYAFFNLLALALCLFLLDDAALRDILPGRFKQKIIRASNPARPAAYSRIPVLFISVLILVVSGYQVFATFGWPVPPFAVRVADWVEPFRIVNRYGLFSVMTTTRPEIIIEGSDDGTTWLEYGFKSKPGDVQRAPTWVEPHQPRLDWQMWFAALGNYADNPWFVSLLVRLQEGSPDVLALLEHNPFPGAPPRYIRARLYDYAFTDLVTLRAKGAWWQRELIGEYFPASSLESSASLLLQIQHPFDVSATGVGVTPPEQQIFKK